MRQLRIGYAEGPGVTVWLTAGCEVAGHNLLRSFADPDRTVEAALDAAVRAAAANRAPAPADPAPIACPATRRLPAPARGASATLVPVLTPDGGVSCAYGASGRLVRGRQLTEGLAELAASMPWTPRATSLRPCVPPVSGGAPRKAAASYLLGLRYGGGVRWLAAGSPPRGRRCSPASNGVFVARTSLYDAAAQAHVTGIWPGSAVTGRLGDDRVLVPTGVVATVTVLTAHRSGTVGRTHAVGIVRALGPVKPRPVAAGVDAWTPMPNGYHVAIDYGFGPLVVIRVDGRSVTGGALGATLALAQARRLTAAFEAVLPRPRR